MSLSLALLALFQAAAGSTSTDARTSASVPKASTAAPAPAPASATVATAVRAVKKPVIDGRDDDEVWREAQPITGFRQFSPVANGDARFRTEAKVAYDN